VLKIITCSFDVVANGGLGNNNTQDHFEVLDGIVEGVLSSFGDDRHVLLLSRYFDQ
jgi:hypothetical protein